MRDAIAPSASPANYNQVIATTDDVSKLTRSEADGCRQTVLPPTATRGTKGKRVLEIAVPGRLGVAPSHVADAETITNEGHALVLDSFGARGVTSTGAKQTQ